MNNPKHVVCYSGGHSSALVAIEVSRKFGTDGLVLLNHDINSSVEAADIKRFKTEVADYIGVPITYANHAHWDTKDQFDVVIDAKAFKVRNGTALCTHRLKTQPFERWLKAHDPEKKSTIYYGFDASETVRIQRRVGILASMGYRSDYPLAFWERTILSTSHIGIEPPNTYGLFKHANCTGCLKASKQHWYLVFLHRKDIWEKAKRAEEVIGYTIMKEQPLEELEAIYEEMQAAGLETTEHEDPRTFFARVRKALNEWKVVEDFEPKPCECFV